MDALLLAWPFWALPCALLMILALHLVRRPATSLSRWRDPSWLGCLVLPVYMVHQFEEHGIDLMGRRFHFIVDLCATIGHPDVTHCPADPAFIFAVNVGAVWIAGVCAVLFRHTNPLVAACALGIPLVNIVAHLGPMVRTHTYNPGVATGVVLFVPFCLYTLRTFVRSGCVPIRKLWLVPASGGLVHVVLLGTLLIYERGFISRPVLLLVETLNGFVPLLLASIATAFTRGAGTAKRQQPSALAETDS